MKHLLLTTIAAVVLVGCGESQQSAPQAETKPEPSTAKAPDISIHKAAQEGNIEAVKQHLAAGADVNAKDEDGWTPLHLAAEEGHKEIAELLIDKGADVNAGEEEAYTPLDHATLWGHKETSDLLRKHGGKTSEELSIHVAAERGNITVFKQHLAAGANVNAKDRVGKTPLDRAITNYQTETADIIRKHGGKTGEELKAEGK